MKVIIEKMNKEHLEKIKENLEKDFDEFWNENVLKSELENLASTYIVAIDEQNNIVRLCWNMATNRRSTYYEYCN